VNDGVAILILPIQARSMIQSKLDQLSIVYDEDQNIDVGLT
jgi:hypothetical protein